MNLLPLRRWGFQTLLRVSAIAGLTSHAISPELTPWHVHALSAVAAIAYTGCMAGAIILFMLAGSV